MLVVDDRLIATRLSGDLAATQSGDWLRAWLLSQKPVAEIRRLLLSPIAEPPIGMPPASRAVCQCIDVSEAAIRAQLATTAGSAEERLTALKATLKCGTECGSCLPELRSMVLKTPSNLQAEAA
jgi:assimilatory nitrate reductase catalytic subunit